MHHEVVVEGCISGFQRATRNLHFTKPPIAMTTMGVPSVAAFETEVIELELEYERKQAMKRLENLDDHLRA